MMTVAFPFALSSSASMPPAETQVPPSGVQRILMCASQPAESRNMFVNDSMRLERCRQRIAIEPRVGAGSRHSPDIGKALDRPRLENRDEIFEAVRRVSDRENGIRQTC
jgi:hypothetical protein